jgi:aryl-alcohol dehydrogenase-like predicted oxidoreductase
MGTFATREGTRAFAKKFKNYKDFFTEYDGMLFSKLGMGTFVKEPYKEENYLFSYKDALKEGILNGVNVLDTANNYRYTVSEEEVGEAVRELIDEGKITRQEVIVATKGGFIPLDFPFPKNPYRWIEQNIIEKGLAKQSDIELDQHCLSADYLEYSCRKSLQNLRLECIDIYFLHNPEMQLQTLGYDGLLVKIGEIFERFEKLADEGVIQSYGIATWNAFSYAKEHEEYLSLQDLVEIAQTLRGKKHRFKYIQTPFNLAKLHPMTVKNQEVAGTDYTLFEAAHKLGIGVFSSCSLLQMHLFKKPFKPEVGYLLDKQMELKSDVQLALQFVRSQRQIVTSLFSTKDPEHAKHNLQIANTKAVSKTAYELLFQL